VKKQIRIIDDTKLTEAQKEAISDSIAELFFNFFSKKSALKREDLGIDGHSCVNKQSRSGSAHV